VRASRYPLRNGCHAGNAVLLQIDAKRDRVLQWECRKKQKIAELTPVHLGCVGPRCSDYQSKKTGVAGSIPITSTIQSSKTGEAALALKAAVSAGIFDGIVRLSWSLETLAVTQAYFRSRSLRSKIPFPAPAYRSVFGEYRVLGTRKPGSVTTLDSIRGLQTVGSTRRAHREVARPRGRVASDLRPLP